MKKLKPVIFGFMAGLITGILLPNLWSGAAVRINGLSDLVMLQKYLEEPFSNQKFFCYLLRIRGMSFFTGAVLGITVLGIPVCMFWTILTGFYMGITLSSMMIVDGIRGFILGIGFLFPHYLIYVPITILLFGTGFSMSRDCWNHIHYSWKEYTFYAMVMILFLAAATAGIFLESYVNPKILSFLMGRLLTTS